MKNICHMVGRGLSAHPKVAALFDITQQVSLPIIHLSTRPIFLGSSLRGRLRLTL